MTSFSRWTLSSFALLLSGGLLTATEPPPVWEASPPPSPAGDSARALPEILAEVRARHPELAVHEASLAAAQADRSAAGRLQDPELTVEVGHKRVRDFTGLTLGEGTTWSVSLSQTFDWPGRLALRKAVANRELELAELGLERWRAALEQRVTVLCLGLHGAARRAQAAAEVSARFTALRDTLLARDPAGLTPVLELRVIEAAEISLRREAAVAQADLEAALIELNQLRGLPATTPVRLRPPVLQFAPTPPIGDLLAAAELGDFELRARRAELERARALANLAGHERRPAITVSPYYSESEAVEREQEFGLGFTVPLPVGGRASAQATASLARRRQAEAALQQAAYAAESALRQAAARYAAGYERRTLDPEAQMRTFQDAAALADRHYRAGALPIGTYVELQRSYLEAVTNLIADQAELLATAGELTQRTGLTLVRVEAQP